MTSGEGPTNASPACSTLRANPAFSERKPYLRQRMRAQGRKHGEYNVPRVDHVHTVFQGDPDDVVLGKVRCDRSETHPHLISLISLQFASVS